MMWDVPRQLLATAAGTGPCTKERADRACFSLPAFQAAARVSNKGRSQGWSVSPGLCFPKVGAVPSASCGALVPAAARYDNLFITACSATADTGLVPRERRKGWGREKSALLFCGLSGWAQQTCSPALEVQARVGTLSCAGYSGVAPWCGITVLGIELLRYVPAKLERAFRTHKHPFNFCLWRHPDIAGKRPSPTRVTVIAGCGQLPVTER